MDKLIVKDLGLVEYQDGLDRMHLFNEQRNIHTKDEIWLLQHPKVFTLGYNGIKTHILQKSDIPIIQSDRGGHVTHHGPGQIVGYILIDLKRKGMNVHNLVRGTEQLIIDTLAHYHIKGHVIAKAPGIYVDNKKICSLGYRIKKNCSYHGFAFNIDMDLTPFSYINPCGYKGLKMTQLSEHVQNISTKELYSNLISKLSSTLGYNDIQYNELEETHE